MAREEAKMSAADGHTVARINIGEELPPRLQQVTQEGINAFHVAFGGSNPIHTDPEAAKKTDLGATVQHGVRTLYTVLRMLFERYPLGLARGGALEAKFIAPVIPGDVIRCHCLALERRQEGERQILVFDIWAVNQKDAKVLVGRASVLEAGGPAANGQAA
jgi:acyl dehydratase